VVLTVNTPTQPVSPAVPAAQSCPASIQTVNGRTYNVRAILFNNANQSEVSVPIFIANGTQEYGATFVCNNGTTSYIPNTELPPNTFCNPGFVVNNGLCSPSTPAPQSVFFQDGDTIDQANAKCAPGRVLEYRLSGGLIAPAIFGISAEQRFGVVIDPISGVFNLTGVQNGQVFLYSACPPFAQNQSCTGFPLICQY
jgi:hypothetical protein